MPGSVSDSYDPEFSTASNARDICSAIQDVVNKITAGPLEDKPVRNILEVVHGKAGSLRSIVLSDKEWRVIRFACNRAIESI